MRDPPAKNKQKIKELTAKLLFHSLKYLFRLMHVYPATPIPEYSNIRRSLCEEIFTELVNEL